jgi:hypothetical protein
MARDIKFLVKDLEETTLKAAREACVEIMNGLVYAGPAHTGEFSSAWYAVPKNKTPGPPRKSSGLYKYDLRNVPKASFKEGGLYRIVNTAPHADEAMDLVPHTYEEFRDVKPLKDRIYGFRGEGATRGDVSKGAGPNWQTAPADWWPTFGSGGMLSKLTKKGANKAFLQFGKARGFG